MTQRPASQHLPTFPTPTSTTTLQPPLLHHHQPPPTAAFITCDRSITSNPRSHLLRTYHSIIHYPSSILLRLHFAIVRRGGAGVSKLKRVFILVVAHMAPPPRSAKGGPARPPPNPIRNQREIRAPTPLLRQAAVNNAASQSQPARRACPNKECDAPNVVDGTCRNCGTIIEDSNIVSEISFGEDARGAAVVQGSYVAEGQGSARSMGPAFKRASGAGEERESTIREGEFQYLAYQREFLANP